MLVRAIISAEPPTFPGWRFDRAPALLPDHHTAAGDLTADRSIRLENSEHTGMRAFLDFRGAPEYNR
jgi:hypothetical protein